MQGGLRSLLGPSLHYAGCCPVVFHPISTHLFFCLLAAIQLHSRLRPPVSDVIPVWAWGSRHMSLLFQCRGSRQLLLLYRCRQSSQRSSSPCHLPETSFRFPVCGPLAAAAVFSACCVAAVSSSSCAAAQSSQYLLYV